MIESAPLERIVWQAYPAWSQFTWLYLFSLLAGLRGAIFLGFGLPGGEVWVVGALLLLVCVGLIRRWALYVITSTHVAVRNGYTGKEIAGMSLQKIREITIKQGPIAGLFGIGTVVIEGVNGEGKVRFRGVKDPEVVKMRIEALRPAHRETQDSA